MISNVYMYVPYVLSDFLLFLFCSRWKSLSLLVSARRNIVVFQFLLSGVCRSLPKYFISLKLSFSLLLFFALCSLHVRKYFSRSQNMLLPSTNFTMELSWKWKPDEVETKQCERGGIVESIGNIRQCFMFWSIHWMFQGMLLLGTTKTNDHRHVSKKDLKNIDKRSSQSLAHQQNDRVIDPPHQKNPRSAKMIFFLSSKN